MDQATADGHISTQMRVQRLGGKPRELYRKYGERPVFHITNSKNQVFELTESEAMDLSYWLDHDKG